MVITEISRRAIPVLLATTVFAAIQVAPAHAAVPEEATFPIAGGDVQDCSDSYRAPRPGIPGGHQGSDCFGEIGDPLLAVEDGTIFQVTNEDAGLGGIRLWLRGNSGTAYYYAHNSRNLVRQGDTVRRGQHIADLGKTGDARNTPPHVHFQIHPDGRINSPTVDPYPHLRRWSTAQEPTKTYWSGMRTAVDGEGYFLLGRDGGIFTFGSAPFSGSVVGRPLNADAVSMDVDPDGTGYYIAGRDGGVFAFDAPFFGSIAGSQLSAPIVGIASTPSGRGYYLAAADGGVFAFGPDAHFQGSLGGTHLSAPIVGIAADPNGSGYLLAASDGGVFTFGAPFVGSMGGQHLSAPVVGISADPDGVGYLLAASDGGVFAFDAPFRGSMGGQHLAAPIVGISADSDGVGYHLIGADGGVFAFDAVFAGTGPRRG